jgi:hypothetical protein
MGGECGTYVGEQEDTTRWFDGETGRGRASLENLNVDGNIKMDHKQQDGSGLDCSP